MTFKTLLAHLDVGQTNTELLQVASDLGNRLDARVVGIAAYQPMRVFDEEMYAGDETIAACEDELAAELLTVETEFRYALQGNSAPVSWRSICTSKALPDYVTDQARCADLLITCVATSDAFDFSRHVDTDDLVMLAGKPVLVVPRAKGEIRFDRVLLAWKDSREARRAAFDALPLMALASQVSVLEIAKEEDLAAAHTRVDDVVAWLAHHGIGADPVIVAASGFTAVQLDAELTNRNIDLVVAGAYSRNPLRGWALGGVTYHLLRGNHCVLLSH